LRRSDDSTIQRAHLLYLRGDKQQARELLEDILRAEPQNRDAMNLLNEIEMEMVEDVLEEERRAGSMEEPLDSGQILGRGLTGTALIILAILTAFPIIKMGMENGFNTEILSNLGRGGGRGRYPIHFLLVFPTVSFLAGIFILLTTYQRARAQSE